MTHVTDARGADQWQRLLPCAPGPASPRVSRPIGRASSPPSPSPSRWMGAKPNEIASPRPRPPPMGAAQCGALGPGAAREGPAGRPCPAECPRAPPAALLRRGQPPRPPPASVSGSGRPRPRAAPPPATRSLAGCDTGRGGAARPLRAGALRALKVAREPDGSGTGIAGVSPVGRRRAR